MIAYKGKRDIKQLKYHPHKNVGNEFLENSK